MMRKLIVGLTAMCMLCACGGSGDVNISKEEYSTFTSDFDFIEPKTIKGDFNLTVDTAGEKQEIKVTLNYAGETDLDEATTLAVYLLTNEYTMMGIGVSIGSQAHRQIPGVQYFKNEARKEVGCNVHTSEDWANYLLKRDGMIRWDSKGNPISIDFTTTKDYHKTEDTDAFTEITTVKSTVTYTY